MTQVEPQLDSPVDPRSAADGPSSGRKRPGWVLPGGAAIVAAVALVGAVVVFAGVGDDDVAPSATSTAVLPAPRPSPASTVPATTHVTAAAVTTTAVPPTTTAGAVAPAPTAPGERPAVYGGAVQDIVLAPAGATVATVATAAVDSVSVYREPLQTPAPAFADWRFGAATQFGTPSVFLVTGVAGDWLRVQLPMKPNGSDGWVHTSEVSLAPNARSVIVDIPNRTVSLYDGATLLAQSVAVVGKSGTPTPTGTYYVTDLLKLDDPSGVYGPYVLATSARSDAFDFFNGGEPIVALHGTNQPSLLGTAASNGCVRLPNEVATQLASMTPLGTPVFIV